MEFDLPDSSAVEQLVLRLKYDTGFVACLNGVMVARDNAPDMLRWFTGAQKNRDDSQAVEFVEFWLDGHQQILVPGRNVLAIHLLDHPADHTDLLLASAGAVGRDSWRGEARGIYDVPLARLREPWYGWRFRWLSAAR